MVVTNKREEVIIVPKVLRSVYVDVDQYQRLQELSKLTRIPQAVFIREGIDEVLTRYLVGGGEDENKKSG